MKIQMQILEKDFYSESHLKSQMQVSKIAYKIQMQILEKEFYSESHLSHIIPSKNETNVDKTFKKRMVTKPTRHCYFTLILWSIVTFEKFFLVDILCQMHISFHQFNRKKS